jgi:hypothetical protein
MPQILADAELARQLEAATGPIQIVSADGKMLAVCMPSHQPRQRPYTDEELEIRRKQVAETRAEFLAHPERFKTLRQIMDRLNDTAGEGS